MGSGRGSRVDEELKVRGPSLPDGYLDFFNQSWLEYVWQSRLRMTTNNALTIKLRNNFHLAFTLWDNFDSGPPVAAKKNKLGISSGIGWSF